MKSEPGLNRTRRTILLAFGMAAAAPCVLAQEKPPFRIAWLSNDKDATNAPMFDAFRQGMRAHGYVEGRSLVIDARWGGGSSERLKTLASEIVQSQPLVIVTQGGASVYPVRTAGAAMPVVFGVSSDPVEAGFVESFARPGRNMTGVTFLSLELVGKRMELLKEAIPRIRRVAIIANPEHPGEKGELRFSRGAAKAAGLALEYYQVRNAAELEEALEGIVKTRSEAIVVFPDGSAMRHSERIAAFAVKNGIPAISGWAEFAERGNLLSYGPNLRVSMQRVAFYVDRVLKGARPADMPVELPTGVELVVNQKAAKALGVTIPQSILVRADKVIE